VDGDAEHGNTNLENRIIDYLNMEVAPSGIDGMWADLDNRPAGTPGLSSKACISANTTSLTSLVREKLTS
jgi:hypothetical protein